MEVKLNKAIVLGEIMWKQGTLTEGEGSVEEANCAEPSPSVSVP